MLHDQRCVRRPRVGDSFLLKKNRRVRTVPQPVHPARASADECGSARERARDSKHVILGIVLRAFSRGSVTVPNLPFSSARHWATMKSLLSGQYFSYNTLPCRPVMEVSRERVRRWRQHVLSERRTTQWVTRELFSFACPSPHK